MEIDTLGTDLGKSVFHLADLSATLVEPVSGTDNRIGPDERDGASIRVPRESPLLDSILAAR